MAFVAAAAWLGVSLKNGVACLLVFVLALQIAGAYQRRQRTAARERPRRPARANERHVSRPKSEPPSRIYDGGGADMNWPVPSEATW
jgi:hypothetical protein